MRPRRDSGSAGDCHPILQPRGLTIPDAALYSGATEWAIRTAIWNGQLKARFAGHQIVLIEDLDLWLDSLPTVPASSAEWLQRRKNRKQLKASVPLPKEEL